MKISRYFTRTELQAAADKIQISLPALLAFAEVESGPFGPWVHGGHGAPTCLFERHIFHRRTGGKWSATHPDLSAVKPTPPGGYGSAAEQLRRLQRAAKLDREAAYRSASFGIFQILGDNFKICGFSSAFEMFGEFFQLRAQLEAFVDFVRSKPTLRHATKVHDWEEAARIYSGRTFRKHRYHERLQAAHTAAVAFCRSWT